MNGLIASLLHRNDVELTDMFKAVSSRGNGVYLTLSEFETMMVEKELSVPSPGTFRDCLAPE